MSNSILKNSSVTYPRFWRCIIPAEDRAMHERDERGSPKSRICVTAAQKMYLAKVVTSD